MMRLQPNYGAKLKLNEPLVNCHTAKQSEVNQLLMMRLQLNCVAKLRLNEPLVNCPTAKQSEEKGVVLKNKKGIVT